MIDLSPVKNLLAEATVLVNELDGEELDDTDAISSQSRGDARRRKAELSQKLQLLATRLEFGASLARNEYWYARGYKDPLDPRRRD